MAKTTKAAAPATASNEARALVDLPEFGAKAGEAFQASPDEIRALVESGQADDHPDAVSHAKA